MKKLTILLGFGLLVFNAVACNNQSGKETASVPANRESAQNEQPEISEMERDAKAMATASCDVVRLFPKVITDDTKPTEESTAIAQKATDMRIAMQEKYTVASGDWEKFEKMTLEIMNNCK